MPSVWPSSIFDPSFVERSFVCGSWGYERPNSDDEDIVQQGGESTSLPGKEESSRANPPVFEDISEDESSKGLDSDAGKCAIVASIFCGPNESSVGENEHTSDGFAQEPELLRMDQETKLRELAIIETLMRRINVSAQTSLSWSLVSSMKRDYPELTTE